MRRGFIVAIERYEQMNEGLSRDLPGTHAHALAFRDWLVTDQQIDPANVCFCAEDPALPGRTSGAERSAIKSELLRLKNIGKDQTDALYFYFSGHGFSFVDGNGVPVTDVLLAADYVDRDTSGDACLRLAEIQKWLRMCLGPGDHYYFVDACRNELSESQIQPIPLGLNYDPSARARPTVYTLYSTSQGTVAPVGASFPEALLDGLRGKGRAKVWRGSSVAVFFDSVRAYAEKRLAKSLDPQKSGSNDGLIKEFPPPPPTFQCSLQVSDAGPADRFDVVVRNARGQQVDSFSFDGPSATYSNVPDDYFLQMTLASAGKAVVTPAAPVFADLYDDCELQFTKAPLDPESGLEAVLFAAPPEAPLVDIDITPPLSGAVIIHHIQRGESVRVAQPEKHRVPPGRYVIETVDDRNAVVDREEMAIEEGPVNIDRRQFRPGALRQTLLSALPHDNGAIFMSESLGPTIDQGLDSWLALIGASRVLGPQQFSKLGPLPLASFASAQPDDAPIYILAGFEDAHLPLRAVVSADWRTAPVPIEPHDRLPGLFEIVQPNAGAAYRYVTVQIGKRTPLTFGAYTQPNRGTLITVTLDERDRIRVQQFMLPLHTQHAAGSYLPGQLTTPDSSELDQPLRVVRRAVEVQRAFAASASLRALLTPLELEELLYFKWVEPIIAILAAYELLRRDERQWMPTVLGNLRLHFSGIADIEALAKLHGAAPLPAHNPPLVLEGYEALDFVATQDAPPRERLVFTGPWTMWSGVAEGG
jgi:hypothetical protein